MSRKGGLDVIANRLKSDVATWRDRILNTRLRQQNPIPDLVWMKLQQQQSAKLSSVCKRSKLRHQSLQKRHLLDALQQRIRLLHELNSVPIDSAAGLRGLREDPREMHVVSVDVGTRNMAWVRGDPRQMRIVDAGVYSLEDANGDRPKAIAQEFSRLVYNFTRSLSVPRNSPSNSIAVAAEGHSEEKEKEKGRARDLFIIEQQMQQHNVRCLIVESQLHAFLFPRTIAISPSSVSLQIGHGSTPTSPISGSGLTGTGSGLTGTGSGSSLKSRAGTSSQQKKRNAVELVKYLGQDSSLGLIDDRVLQFLESEKKKDDLSDAILQFLCFCGWNDQVFAFYDQLCFEVDADSKRTSSVINL